MARNFFSTKKRRFTMTFNNKDEFIENLSTFFTGLGDIDFAYIHGSFLTEGTFADIDVAVYLNKNALPAGDRLIRYELELELKLEDKFGYDFDLRIINNVPLSFRYNVLKYGKLIFTRDEEMRTIFVSRTIDDYIDFLPYRKRYLKEVLGLEI